MALDWYRYLALSATVDFDSAQSTGFYKTKMYLLTTILVLLLVLVLVLLLVLAPTPPEVRR